MDNNDNETMTQSLQRVQTNSTNQLEAITMAVTDEAEKKLYQQLIGEFPVGLYIWKMDDHRQVNSFRLKAANRFAERFTGLKNSAIIGKLFLEVFPQGGIFTPIYHESIRTKEPLDFGEVEYTDENIKSGQGFFRLRCFPLPNWTIGVLFENVSDARQTEERRKQNKKKLDELLDIVIDKFLDPHQESSEILQQTLQSMLTFAEDATTKRTSDSMSVSELVRNLTNSDSKDHNQFVENFLISYRYFITPKALLKKLILRFSNMANSKEDNRKQELQKIADVLQTWLKKHFYDFHNDHELLDTARSFIDAWIGDQLDDKTATKLQIIITKNIAAESLKSGRESRGSFSSHTNSMGSVTTTSSNSSESEYDFEAQKLNFLDMDPKETAHQLTLLVFENLREVAPLELYNQSWSKEKSKKLNSPNVVALIDHFNRISNWVTSIIVFNRDIRKRVALIKYFLQVAEECLLNGDYETVFTITLGLEQFCVSRLQKTWGQLLADADCQRIWSKLQEVISFSQNYKNYRSIYKTNMEQEKMFIPYIGLYLKDLTFIEDGNETISNDVVNFHKMSMIASIIQDIQTLQTRINYDFKKNHELQHFFNFGLFILSEDDTYEHSKLCEGLGSQTSTPVAVKRGFNVNLSLKRGMKHAPEHDTSVVVVKNPLFGVDKRKLECIQGMEKSRRIMQKILL